MINDIFKKFLDETNYCFECGSQRCEKDEEWISACNHFKKYKKDMVKWVNINNKFIAICPHCNHGPISENQNKCDICDNKIIYSNKIDSFTLKEF